MFGEYRNEFVKKAILALTVLTTVFMQSQMEVKAWWSCMYPSIGLEQSIAAVVDEDGTRREKDKMTKDDYEEVSVTSKVKARSYIFELLK